MFSSLFLLTRIQQCFKTNAQMYLQLNETLWGLDKNFKSGNFEMANMRKTSNIFKKRYLSSNKDIYVYLCIHYNIYTHVYLYTYIISYYNMCMCMYINKYIYTHKYIIYIYAYIYILCIYIYICTYIYKYIYIYINIYINI